MIEKTQGVPIVVSAPSGAGKTTLCKMAADWGNRLSGSSLTESKTLTTTSELLISISHTTRKPRPQEEHGKNYFFTSKEDFQKQIEEDFFLEWAEVYGNYYGSSKNILKLLEKKKDVLFDIDIQGGLQIKSHLPETKLVYILPPSLKVLEQRLRDRKSDAEEVIQKRMALAEKEMLEAKKHYEYFIINENLQHASQELIGLIQSFRIEKQNMDLYWSTVRN